MFSSFARGGAALAAAAPARARSKAAADGSARQLSMSHFVTRATQQPLEEHLEGHAPKAADGIDDGDDDAADEGEEAGSGVGAADDCDAVDLVVDEEAAAQSSSREYGRRWGEDTESGGGGGRAQRAAADDDGDDDVRIDRDGQNEAESEDGGRRFQRTTADDDDGGDVAVEHDDQHEAGIKDGGGISRVAAAVEHDRQGADDVDPAETQTKRGNEGGAGALDRIRDTSGEAEGRSAPQLANAAEDSLEGGRQGTVSIPEGDPSTSGHPGDIGNDTQMEIDRMVAEEQQELPAVLMSAGGPGAGGDTGVRPVLMSHDAAGNSHLKWDPQQTAIRRSR